MVQLRYSNHRLLKSWGVVEPFLISGLIWGNIRIVNFFQFLHHFLKHKKQTKAFFELSQPAPLLHHFHPKQGCILAAWGAPQARGEPSTNPPSDQFPVSPVRPLGRLQMWSDIWNLSIPMVAASYSIHCLLKLLGWEGVLRLYCRCVEIVL